MIIKMCSQTHRIIYTGSTEVQQNNAISFLAGLSQGVGEPLYFEEQTNGLVVDCSKAPQIWDMLYGLQQAALEGEISVVSVERIAEPERPQA